MAFSLLCNAADVEALSMTSESHAWNKVRLYGNWYEVDCTWDDPVSADGKQYLFYDFFDRSEEYLNSQDSASAHVSESFHATYNTPACNYDSEGTEENGYRLSPGVIPEAYKITARTAAPVIRTAISGAQTDGHVVLRDAGNAGLLLYPGRNDALRVRSKIQTRRREYHCIYGK